MSVVININGSVNSLVVNTNRNGTSITANGNEVWSNAPGYPPYLTFSSAGAFTLMQVAEMVAWDGTIEYSTNTTNWSTWDGSTISSAANNGTHYLYMRGTGNTVISSADNGWYLDGSGISCDGDIRMLLDYADPENAVMAEGCFSHLFETNDSLIKAPDFLSTVVPRNAYNSAFLACSSLVTPGKIAATSIGLQGCSQMFMNCAALSALPEIKATSIGTYGMLRMFAGCSLIKLSETQTGEYQTPYRIPSEGTGSFGTGTATSMFQNTGGTFVGAPTVNTTYYTSNTVVS